MTAAAGVRQRVRRRVLTGLAALLVVPAVRAQDADSRPPITLIIPAPSGVSADRLGRIVAEGLSRILEVDVRVANIAGDSGVTGTNAIAVGANDGTVLGLGLSSAMMGGRLLSRAARFNPIDDFQWLAILGTFPTAMVIAAQSAHRDLDAWLAAAREAPSAMVYASIGTGSAGHLAGAYLRQAQGAKLAHRAVESAEERYALLADGRIDALFDGIPNAMIEAPRSTHRIIAVTSAARAPSLPDVPSFGELWRQSFDVWIGLIAPKGLDNSAYLRLAAAVGVLLDEPRFGATMRAAGASVMGLSGRGTRDFLDAELLRNARLIAALNQEGLRN